MGSETPAAPLEKAVANAREALANNCHPYTECMNEGVSCYQRMDDALRNLLAARDADKRLEEAEKALGWIRDSPTAMGKDIARRYFARREGKEVPE